MSEQKDILIGPRLIELLQRFGSMIQPKKRMWRIIFKLAIALARVSIINFVKGSDISEKAHASLIMLIGYVEVCLETLSELLTTYRNR